MLYENLMIHIIYIKHELDCVYLCTINVSTSSVVEISECLMIYCTDTAYHI